MTIYIDLLFILNFIYDAIILLTVSITLKRNTSFKRIVLGALIGSLSSFLILIPINKYLLFILKILAGFIMLLVTFKYNNLKYFINNTIYLYMTSVILAGFLYFLKIEFNNLCYLISLSIAPLILYLYIKEQNKLKKVVNYYKKVLITLKNNRVLELTGFIDSGNKLRDPITNKYIVLVNKNKLKGIYNIRSPMYVPIKTVNSTSLLECISIKNIIIDNQIYTDYLLGLSETFNGFDGIDCLLNYHLLEE
ncbi:MAG: sigma-E processing peptidase SpoIIGA [Bacilli bacterium]|nr:sigma-E processing peptidase SpoIIGA [Bacilli bacterium]